MQNIETVQHGFENLQCKRKLVRCLYLESLRLNAYNFGGRRKFLLVHRILGVTFCCPPRLWTFCFTRHTEEGHLFEDHGDNRVSGFSQSFPQIWIALLSSAGALQTSRCWLGREAFRRHHYVLTAYLHKWKRGQQVAHAPSAGLSACWRLPYGGWNCQVFTH